MKSTPVACFGALSAAALIWCATEWRYDVNESRPGIPDRLPDVLVVGALVGEPVTFEIPIRNESNRPLKVLGATDAEICGSEGCRSLFGFPLEIAPNRSASVQGTFTGRKPAMVEQEVVLITDQAARRRVAVKLRIEVERDDRLDGSAMTQGTDEKRAGEMPGRNAP